MLKSLSIVNYALIQSLEMEPSESLNMITGETGAGKSIMLGAVGLLLGKRADTKTLFNPETKCIVEGHFSIENYGLEEFFQNEDLDFDSFCIIRREISPNGKSRAFINDTPVNLDVLKELGKSLLDIHSQHESLLLGEGGYQLSLVDAYCQSHSELYDYQNAYSRFHKAKKNYAKLSEQAFELRKEADFNRFQLDELSQLNLRKDEQLELEEQQEILENAEEIKSKINEIAFQFNDEQFGSLMSLSQINLALNHLSKYSPKFESYQDRFRMVLIEIKDIISSLQYEEQHIEVDMESLDIIRERLSKIFHLQQKHNVDSVSGLIDLEKELENKIFKIDHLDVELEKTKRELAESEKSMLTLAKTLSDKRKSVFDSFSQQLVKLLNQLGMENAKVEFFSHVVPPGKGGIDEIDILFSANKGVNTQPLKMVASGGEFSRFIFAIKYIMADKMALPTLIFDEIDTGVSGEVALQIVRMMQKISTKHQVICISHLPQVAAKGDRHFFVYKDNSSVKTISKIKLLDPQDRILEIAKMIAGEKPSANAVRSAQELLGE